jgi:cellulose biosynthesis protein BcsQ
MVIAFYNNKGGVGKTSCATHTFRYCARAGEPWAFYDADPQRDGLSWLSRHSAEAIEAGEAWCEDPETGKPTKCLVTTDLDAALAFPNVLVDAPPRGDFLRRLSEHAPPDLVIVPVSGRLSVEGAGHVVDEAARVGARVIAVFNMTDAKERFSRVEAAAARKLGVEVFPLAIPRSDTVRKAELKGVSVWDLPHAERTPVVKALRSLCAWIAAGAKPSEVPAPRERARKALRRRDLWDR